MAYCKTSTHTHHYLILPNIFNVMNRGTYSREDSTEFFGFGDTTFTRNTIYKGNITQNIMIKAGASINEDAP